MVRKAWKFLPDHLVSFLIFSFFFFFAVVVCFVLTGCINSSHFYIGSILLQLTIQHPTGARELDCNHIYIYTHFYYFFLIKNFIISPSPPLNLQLKGMDRNQLGFSPLGFSQPSAPGKSVAPRAMAWAVTGVLSTEKERVLLSFFGSFWSPAAIQGSIQHLFISGKHKPTRK